MTGGENVCIRVCVCVCCMRTLLPCRCVVAAPSLPLHIGSTGELATQARDTDTSHTRARARKTNENKGGDKVCRRREDGKIMNDGNMLVISIG